MQINPVILLHKYTWLTNLNKGDMHLIDILYSPLVCHIKTVEQLRELQ
jgi:hypothetical protein